MDLQQLKTDIYQLELRSVQPEARETKERMQEFLDDDCFEFCSSGKIYYFREDNFEYDGPGVFDFEIKDFEIMTLADDVVLATYKGIKHHETGESMKYSLRSSIWKKINGQWKVVFHQGTLTGKFYV
jgi:hypothetical protein